MEKLHQLIRAVTDRTPSSNPSQLIEVSSKPSTCSACGSHRILEIVYGLRESPIPLGEGYVLGGCIFYDDESPSWQCGDCNAQFFSRVKDTTLVTIMLAEG